MKGIIKRVNEKKKKVEGTQRAADAHLETERRKPENREEPTKIVSMCHIQALKRMCETERASFIVFC